MSHRPSNAVELWGRGERTGGLITGGRTVLYGHGESVAVTLRDDCVLLCG